MGSNKKGCKTVLTLFIGILIGVLISICLLVLTGVWAYNNVSINTVQSMLNTELVDLGEYNNKPIKELVVELSNISEMSVQEIDEKFLSSEISNNLIITINDKKINLADNLFKDVMQGTTAELKNNVAKINENFTLGFVCDNFLESSFILTNSKFLKTNSNVQFSTAFENIKSQKVCDILEEGKTFENSKLQAIYDSIKDLTIDELSSNSEKLDDSISSIKLESILEINDSSSKILKAMRTWAIGDISTKIETLKFSEVLEIDDNATGLIASIKDWTLGDNLEAKIDELTLGEALDIDSSATGLLYAIKDWKVGDDLESKINNDLTLKDIITIDDSSVSMLKALKDSKVGELSTSISNLRLKPALGLGAFDFDSNNDGVKDSFTGFIGLLFESDATSTDGPKICDLQTKLNDIDVESLTLFNLKNRGIITTDIADLNKSIGTKQLGNYTVYELVEYVAATA